MSTPDAEHPVLADIRAELDRRQTAYYAVPPVADVIGWEQWIRCARNAAWCRLIARSWDRLAEFGARHDPRALGTLASSYAVYHHDAERERWRSLAMTAAGDRCPERDRNARCRWTVGHLADHAPRPDRT